MGGNILSSDLHMESFNEAALEALSQNEIYQAQTLFRQNAKKNPCFITFNNLGVFHVFEGLVKSDNSGRRATKLGVRYLKKAEAYQKSNLTLLALGSVCSDAKDYEEASEYFRQACELKPDYASIYNCGVSYYMQGEYGEAVQWFQKALDICNSDYYSEMFIPYTFSLLYSNKKEFLEAFHKMLKFKSESMEWETFIFAYFADELLMAESQIEYMLENFSLDIHDMAIVFDCLLKLGKEEKATEYLKQKLENLEESDYNMQPEINRMKKALFHAHYRAKLIADYRHKIPFIEQCCYYGCKQHNPI